MPVREPSAINIHFDRREFTRSLVIIHLHEEITCKCCPWLSAPNIAWVLCVSLEREKTSDLSVIFQPFAHSPSQPVMTRSDTLLYSSPLSFLVFFFFLELIGSLTDFASCCSSLARSDCVFPFTYRTLRRWLWRTNKGPGFGRKTLPSLVVFPFFFLSLEAERDEPDKPLRSFHTKAPTQTPSDNPTGDCLLDTSP